MIILGSDLRSGGLNRSLLQEISIRIHWKYSRTPTPAKKMKIYRQTPDQPPQRPLCYEHMGSDDTGVRLSCFMDLGTCQNDPVYRSKGFARAAYFVPGRDGIGVWPNSEIVPDGGGTGVCD